MDWPPIEELIPHRAPMSLLDRVTGFDGAEVTCEVTVREGAAFVEDGVVPSAVFIEYMAQAAAAHAGVAARIAGVVPPMGYLLAARELTLEVDGARVGERLTVRATLQWDGGVTALYVGDVRDREGRALASARFSVYRGDPMGLTS